MMRNLIVLSLLVFATACGVSTRIESNKSPDFSGKITKVFLLVKETDKAKAFLYPFVTSFERELTAKGVAYKEYYIDPLSLETEDDIQKKIQEYGANNVMLIAQSESHITHTSGNYNSGFGGPFGNNYGGGGFGFGTTGYNRKITGGVFDVKLFTPEMKNPVWHANLYADAPSGIKKAVEQANEKFVNKLIEDQLLDGPPIKAK